MACRRMSCVPASGWRSGSCDSANTDELELGRKLLEKIVPTLTPDQLADAQRRLAAWRPGKE